MLTDLQLQVVASLWSDIDETEDDVSTERLFALTCYAASEGLGVDVDEGDVTMALERYGAGQGEGGGG